MIQLQRLDSIQTRLTRQRTRLGLTVAALALTLVACVEPAAAPGSVSLPSARIVTVDGDPWRVLAAGEDGMRGQAEFGDADGMLFDMGAEVAPSAIAFVMDGVTIPLDIAWFAADGRLVGIAQMTPCAAEPCPRYVAPGPFRWAIEAPPQAFDGLAPDAHLEVRP
jgi:uncharacterized membrane protein (UPF0127 family)